MNVAPGARLVIIGNVNADLVVGPAAPWPEPGTETIVENMEFRLGGSAGNAALAAAAIGAPVTLVSNTGLDLVGNWLRGAFAHLDCRWEDSGEPTLVAVGITHPDGERTFFTPLVHLKDFTAELPRRVLAEVPAASIALICGQHLLPALRPALPGLQATARARGLRVAVDPGWPPDGWTPAVRRESLAWLAEADEALLNEVEARGLSGEEDLTAAAARLLERLPPGGVLVVKRGADGADAWRQSAGSLEQAHADAPSVQVADTVGAGDTFNAAYLNARLNGLPLGECLMAGVSVASYAVSTSPRRYRA